MIHQASHGAMASIVCVAGRGRRCSATVATLVPALHASDPVEYRLQVFVSKIVIVDARAFDGTWDGGALFRASDMNCASLGVETMASEHLLTVQRSIDGQSEVEPLPLAAACLRSGLAGMAAGPREWLQDQVDPMLKPAAANARGQAVVQQMREDVTRKAAASQQLKILFEQTVPSLPPPRPAPASKK
jgi:hypothetical protein